MTAPHPDVHHLLHPVQRWTAHRKERPLDAVVRGELTKAEIWRAHGITSAELNEWARGFIAANVPGLKATRRVPA